MSVVRVRASRCSAPSSIHTFMLVLLFSAAATSEIYTFPYTTLFRSSQVRVAPQNLRSFLHEPGLVHGGSSGDRSEEHTSELQSLRHLVCRLLLEKKKKPHNAKHKEEKR